MSSEKNHKKSMGDIAESPDSLYYVRKCRTARFIENYSICLIKDLNCKYSLTFGLKCICTNPQHREFLDKSDNSDSVKNQDPIDNTDTKTAE
jgi:hypothetical protein